MMRSKGFTIVELLIVVVVIAILAAITTVAYNGVSERALNSSRISAARSALTLIQLYGAQNVQYPVLPDNPTSPGTRAACLGTGWPTLQGAPVCWNIFTDGGAPGFSTYPEVNSVNQALSTVGTLPKWPQKNVYEGTYGTTPDIRPLHINGMVLIERPTAPNSSYQLGYSFAYILAGSPSRIDCGVSGAVKQAELADERHRNFTICIVPLPAL